MTWIFQNSINDLKLLMWCAMLTWTDRVSFFSCRPTSISSEEPDISHPNSFLNPISYLVLFKHNLSSIYRVGEVGGVMNESMRMLSIIYQFPLFLIWIECGEDGIWKGLTVNRFWIVSGWLWIEWYHLVSSDQFCFAEATKVMIECLGDGQSGE